MTEEPLGAERNDPLAAERARLLEAARALDEERERLQAAGGAGEASRGSRRGERRRPLLDMDEDLCAWWRENRPSRVLYRFLRDVPDEFVEHLRAARREQLLALRTIVDYALEYNERPRARDRERRAREVPIEDV